MTDSLARARELVTPEMMSEVFAASVRRKDPDHPHLYDHRIGAEKLNELLQPLLATAVREARVQEAEWWFEQYCPTEDPQAYARLRSLKEGQASYEF